MCLKLVFCGTPEFAVPTLEAVIAVGHEVALVVTQPDRAAGRGMELQAPPVKRTALAHGIPVVQPEKIKANAEIRERLEEVGADAILVVAYGRIIPKWMLDLPRLGCINLHGSLLPKYRGAAPIQWAVAMGETVTGNTTMLLEEGLDTGPILLQQEIAIRPEQTAADLWNRWRGFQPWPGVFTVLDGKKLIAHRLQVAEITSSGRPGEVRVEDRMVVACAGNTWLEMIELQLEGKKRLSAAEFLRGAS